MIGAGIIITNCLFSDTTDPVGNMIIYEYWFYRIQEIDQLLHPRNQLHRFVTIADITETVSRML